MKGKELISPPGCVTAKTTPKVPGVVGSGVIGNKIKILPAVKLMEKMQRHPHGVFWGGETSYF